MSGNQYPGQSGQPNQQGDKSNNPGQRSREEQEAERKRQMQQGNKE